MPLDRVPRQSFDALGACRSNGFDDTATKNAIAHLAQDQRSRSDQYVSYPPKSTSEHFSDTLLDDPTLFGSSTYPD